MEESTEKYFQANKDKMIRDIIPSEIKCSVLDTSASSLKKAGAKLASGGLVSFPTETVYGLGANALNKDAVLSIYKAKGRPLSDPIIVHVLQASQILEYSIVSETEKKLVEFFDKNFWPGPLTMVVRANPKYISPVLTASTDFVGFRIPNHPIARRLLEESQVPIAAPSANIFGHVSPTSSAHVFNDFWNQNITIIDGGVSEWGVESSVIKCTADEAKQALHIFVFRAGSLSLKSLQGGLVSSGLFPGGVVIEVKPKESHVAEDVNTVAPGQILKHYAPRLPTYLLTGLSNDEKMGKEGIECKSKPLEEELKETKNAVLIDFAGKFASIHSSFGQVFDLSSKGDYVEAMHNLYEVLRISENVEKADFIVVGDLSLSLQEEVENFKNDEFSETVYDKIFRCASGVKATYSLRANKLKIISLNRE
jgi:L-threonylcarbamoyladenylate synthase